MSSTNSRSGGGLHARLVVIGGRASKNEVELKLPATIGRGERATVLVHHPTVSRAHCEILEQNGMLMLRDLKSLNGTFVGNERVEEALLMPGDSLTIGPLTFQVNYVPSQQKHLASGEPEQSPPGEATRRAIGSAPANIVDLDVQEVEFASVGDHGQEGVDNMIDFVLGLNVADEEDSGIHTRR
jgi:pSer/pThr/pTyr-binding forkhead associated (FHA) protein